MSPSANKHLNWVLLGNPENRRVRLFQAALTERGQPPAEIVAYSDLLRSPALLGRVLEQCCSASRTRMTALRLESPGENHQVERALIARGAAKVPGLARLSALRLRNDHGRVRYVRQWYAGFSTLLADIEATLTAFPDVIVQNHPGAIRLLFDKPRCQALLADHGVRTPRALPPVRDYEHLLETMSHFGCPRIFAKLAYGSSASGVVAFNTQGARPVAITTLELVRRSGAARFYNNLKLSHYDRTRDLHDLFAFLCGEGIHVEQWLPKAAQGGRNFDLRVVTFNGRPCHAVVRTSRSPLTNLHLGNRRGDLEQLKQAAGRRWNSVTELCEQAAAAVPQASYVGWDVLVTPGFRRAYILEGNAFGDLVPGVMHLRKSTYAFGIEDLESRLKTAQHMQGI